MNYENNLPRMPRPAPADPNQFWKILKQSLFFELWLMVFAMFGASSAFADDPKNPPVTNPPPANNNPPPANNAPPTHVTLTREEYDKLMAGNKKDGGPDPEDDLNTKAKREREAQNKNAADSKKIETALSFTMGVEEYVKVNKDLLPSEIPEILKVASKENYDTAIGKANAIKVAIIQSYFGVQGNKEALTKAQIETLDDYLKLTKNAKEERAVDIYQNIFEPALETVRKIKKAEDLSRSRNGFVLSTTDADAAYKQKMMKHSQRVHLGIKEA